MKRIDPAVMLKKLQAMRQPAPTVPDPDAEAVYAQIEDDKTPDPIPEPEPKTHRSIQVIRSTDPVNNEDVITILGVPPDAAQTVLRILDLAANGGPRYPWGHIDPIRRGLRRVLRED